MTPTSCRPRPRNRRHGELAYDLVVVGFHGLHCPSSFSPRWQISAAARQAPLTSIKCRPSCDSLPRSRGNRCAFGLTGTARIACAPPSSAPPITIFQTRGFNKYANTGRAVYPAAGRLRPDNTASAPKGCRQRQQRYRRIGKGLPRPATRRTGAGNPDQPPQVPPAPAARTGQGHRRAGGAGTQLEISEGVRYTF